MGFTKELLVTYSVALDNSQSRLWMVDYYLPKNLWLRGSQLEDELTGSVSQRLYFDFHRAPESRSADSGLRVASVRIDGGLPGFEEKARKEVRTKPGERFDYWKTQDDARRLRRLTRGEGYLGAVVDVEKIAAEERGVDLVYRVDPGRRVELVWEGDDPGSKIRKRTEEDWDGGVPESFLVSELASEALGELKRQGYYEARIETVVADTPAGSRRVTFHVSRGPGRKRLVVDFEGNEAVSDRELREALPPASSPELYDLLFENTARLRRTLEMFFASRGYLAARVREPAEAAEQANNRLRIVIPVHEGPLSRVTSIELRGAESIEMDTLLGALSLRKDAPFLLSKYRDDRATLASIYRREGFVDVRVRGSLQRSEDSLVVVFEIDEGPRALVGDVRIVGNRATRTDIIRRQLTFAQGDPVRLADLTETQRRLSALGIFRAADVRVAPADGDSTERTVVIEVTEAADLNASYGLRYNSQERFEILTELRAPNLFGGGQHAGLIVKANSRESLVRGTFHTPYLFTRFDLGTDIFVSRETDETEFFATKAWSFTFQQTRGLSKWLDLKWSYRFRRSRTVGKIPPDIPDFPPFDVTVDQALLSSSLIEDRRDSVIRPRRGRFSAVTLQGAPTSLGSDISFVKFFGQFILFVPLGHDAVWASSYRLGIADAFDQVLPPDDRFNSGGFDSVRGFAQDSLGPVDPFTGTTIGGEGLAVFNQEVRLPLYRWFRWAVFFDAGNVYLNASDFDPLDLRYSGGVGIRFDLPFGLLRLDWARAFNRRPGDKASQLWFSFGHAF
jgi:outer membrane protein insertion porin family